MCATTHVGTLTHTGMGVRTGDQNTVGRDHPAQAVMACARCAAVTVVGLYEVLGGVRAAADHSVVWLCRRCADGHAGLWQD